MKKIITAFIFIGTIGFSVTVQETVYFYDFIAEDGRDFELLQQIQKKRADEKEFYTTHDTMSCTDLLEKVVQPKGLGAYLSDSDSDQKIFFNLYRAQNELLLLTLKHYGQILTSAFSGRRSKKVFAQSFTQRQSI